MGQYTEASGNVLTLAEHWTEGSWTIQSTPSPRSGIDVLLAASCTTATACTASGFSLDRSAPLVERWNGTTWTQQRTIERGSSSLEGVACRTERTCVAVGNETSGAALAEHWNGTTWSSDTVPNPADPFGEGHPTRANRLVAVSCPSESFCAAIGEYEVELGVTSLSFPLMETWNGRAWSVGASPEATGFMAHGLSCTSSTSCTAVGYEEDSIRRVTLVLHWNGSTWAIQETPSPGTSFNDLLGVSCTSSTACVAVGSCVERSGRTLTLALNWNGSAWTRQESPNPTDVNALEDVSCTSATACTAVGSRRERAGTATTFALRYA